MLHFQVARYTSNATAASFASLHVNSPGDYLRSEGGNRNPLQDTQYSEMSNGNPGKVQPDVIECDGLAMPDVLRGNFSAQGGNILAGRLCC